MTIQLSLLPGRADNTWGYNGVPFIQDNVLTTGDVQYAVWWNDAREPIIGKRTMPTGAWSTFDLSTVGGNPLASPVDLDAHNDIVIGIDSNGRLHIAANHHGHPIRYVRSVNPHDITSWTTNESPGQGFTTITYPQFFRLATGVLYLSYREGASGDGDDWLERWNATSGTWEAQTKVVDGKSTSDNGYLHHIAVGPDDSIHYAIVWRASGNANSNNDLCHIRSLNGGVDWQDMAENPVSLPVTHTSAPKVLDTAATDSGLLNTCGLDIDGSGLPHIATHIYNDAGDASRVLYSRWNGTAWVNTKMFTDWQYQMPLDVSVINSEIARPSIFCTSGGRTVILYRNNRDSGRNLRIRDVSTGQDVSILNLDTYAYEPTFDSRAVRDKNALHLLVTPCRTADSGVAEYDDQDWTDQPLGILTVDLSNITAVLSGGVTVPNAWADTTPLPPAPVLSPVATAAARTRVEWFGCNLVTGAIIAELPEVRGTVSRVLGAYTSSTLTIPIPRAGPAAVGDVIYQATQPGPTMVVAVVNDVPSWGGIVLTRQGGTDANLALGCVSLEGYLNRRYVGDHTWVNQDEASVIAAGLIADAQISGIGLTVDAPATGRLRNRTYQDQDDATVYSRLRELAAVLNGPEWTIDLDWVDTSKQAIAKIIRVRSRIGTASASPGAVFSSKGRSEARYQYAEDYTEGRGANYVIATSTGEGEDRPQSAPASSVAAGWPRWERRISPSTSITDVAVLNDHAAAELALRATGAKVFTLETRWGAFPLLNVDWALGDDVAWELFGHRHPAGVVGNGRAIGWELDMEAGVVRPILWEPDADEGA